jgi:hypothetical protein
MNGNTLLVAKQNRSLNLRNISVFHRLGNAFLYGHLRETGEKLGYAD